MAARSASSAALRPLPLLAVLLAVPRSSSQLPDALVADDECASPWPHAHPVCGLNALQARAQKTGAAKPAANQQAPADAEADPEADPKATRTQPAWCEFVPEDAKPLACTKPAACTCASFCSALSGAVQRWVLQCCACEAALLQQKGLEASLRHPAWCARIPEASKPLVCTAFNTCGCASFCARSARYAWTWNPWCCGCQQ
mmetsp:Transcript_56461/g.175405  ORF Transcript_56461/g.175405 Transcript_56461/m.175405 type:complete len:201 (+) Transcript_56461:97-699(+)